MGSRAYIYRTARWRKQAQLNVTVPRRSKLVDFWICRVATQIFCVDDDADVTESRVNSR